MRIFVTRRLPLDPRSIVSSDLEVGVSPHDRPLLSDEIAEMAADADGLVSMLSDPLDASLIRRLPRLKVISNFAVGVNNIDLDAAEAGSRRHSLSREALAMEASRSGSRSATRRMF